MSKIKNITDIRNSLIDVFEKLESSKMSIKDAKAMTDVSGKIISTAKTELQYNTLMKNKKRIAFLEK